MRTAIVEEKSPHKAVKRLLDFVVDITEVKKANSIELATALSHFVNGEPHDMVVLMGASPVSHRPELDETESDTLDDEREGVDGAVPDVSHPYVSHPYIAPSPSDSVGDDGHSMSLDLQTY